MHVVILGSGVVGVASAWYLARAGHQVTVLDRQPDAALVSTAGNAGQISPGYAAPWAGPGVPLKAVKWMFQNHAPLAIPLDGSSFQLELSGTCCATAICSITNRIKAVWCASLNTAATARKRCAKRPALSMKDVRAAPYSVPYPATVRQREQRY